jgi:Putative transposase
MPKPAFVPEGARTARSASASAPSLDTNRIAARAPGCRLTQADGGRWSADRLLGLSRSQGRTRRATACQRAGPPVSWATTACRDRGQADRSSAGRRLRPRRARPCRRRSPPIWRRSRGRAGSSTPRRPFAGPKAVLAYLSRYTHRVAISNRRLIAAESRALCGQAFLRHQAFQRSEPMLIVMRAVVGSGVIRVGSTPRPACPLNLRSLLIAATIPASAQIRTEAALQTSAAHRLWSGSAGRDIAFLCLRP